MTRTRILARLTRRKLLFLSASVVGAGGAIWLLGARKPASHARVVAILIRKKLDYLTLDADEVDAFARQYVQREGWMFTSLLRKLSALRPFYEHTSWLDDPSSRELESLEENVCTRFLMSSSFFWDGADTTKPVRYLGYYPGNTVCPNPFARD